MWSDDDDDGVLFDFGGPIACLRLCFVCLIWIESTSMASNWLIQRVNTDSDNLNVSNLLIK